MDPCNLFYYKTLTVYFSSNGVRLSEGKGFYLFLRNLVSFPSITAQLFKVKGGYSI